MFTLDGRLAVCASLVRKGAKLADVGTDHAYLPVWLAKNDSITSALASDIREKPLRSGADNIEKYGCSEIVAARLSDGLDAVLPEEADDIVMAGMGSELICNIIERAPWLKDSDKRLILQPMTKAHILRKYLLDNGFEIVSETPCAHGGKNYTVILARYSGIIMKAESSFYYMGRLDPADHLSRDYMKGVLSKIYKKRNGISVTGGDTSELDGVIAEIIKLYGDDINDSSQRYL